MYIYTYLPIWVTTNFPKQNLSHVNDAGFVHDSWKRMNTIRSTSFVETNENNSQYVIRVYRPRTATIELKQTCPDTNQSDFTFGFDNTRWNFFQTTYYASRDRLAIILYYINWFTEFRVFRFNSCSPWMNISPSWHRCFLLFFGNGP